MARDMRERAVDCIDVAIDGNPVPPAMWSDLYQLTNEAKAVLAKMRGKVEA